MIINPKTIYVLDKNENVKAVFNKDDKDTLIDPEIEEKQNSEAVLTFRVNAKSKKWKETYNPENLYLVGNKVFSANFDSCIEESKEAEGQDVIMVTAYERQKLLERNYVRAWNSTTGFDKIDEFMVVIVGKGDLDLFNNGEKVNPKYPKGSSGYVLEGLLYGTGWTVGDCDLYEYKNGNLVKDENGNPKYEIFDLETDQENIYDNIKKVQELWGGILIFDSLNKVVHHRDEVKFLPYSGYEVRYAKNLVSAKYIGNNRIITQMCPLGEGSLNIGSVNPALDENGNIIYEKVEDENGNMVNKPKPNIWLTNFSYTNSVYKSIENNPDIYEPEQLKRWGERKLQELCKPRKELSVKTVLLNESPALINTGFHYEELHLHDIVDIIDYDLIEGKTEQLRVIEFSYKVWSPDDARITLSDITLESTDIFRKAVKATNSINNGTLNTTQIIDSHKNGSSLNQSLREIDQIITTTNSELIKAQDMIKASIRETTVGIDNLNNEIVSQSQRLAEMLLQIDNISFTIENSLDLNKVIKGNTKIIIPDAIKGELISLSIHGYNGSFTDKNVHFKVTTNNQKAPDSKEEPENLNNEYSYQIDDELREIITESDKDGDDTYITTQNGEYLVTDKDEKLITGKRIKKYFDEFRVADGKVSLIRRIGKKDNGDLYLLQEPVITVLGDLIIPVLEGKNDIEVLKYTPDMTISYVNQNLYTDMFATRIEVKNQIAITDEKIVLLSNKTVSKGEIIQELNSQISVSPEIINIYGNKIKIDTKDDVFHLTEDGQIKATQGEIAGLTMSHEKKASYLYKNFLIDDVGYQSGILIPDEEVLDAQFKPFIYAGCNLNETLDKSNLVIQHNGLVKAKWFAVNGESGYFYVNYNNGNRAMSFDKAQIRRYLSNGNLWTIDGISYDNDGNPHGTRVWLHDAIDYGISDDLHPDKGGLFRITRWGNKGEPPSSIFWTNFIVSNDNGKKYLEIDREGNRIDLKANEFIFWKDNTHNPLCYFKSDSDVAQIYSTLYIEDHDGYIRRQKIQTQGSDRRLKEKIEDSKDNALIKINKIKIRQFDWNEKEEKFQYHKHVNNGYIAQEVEKIDNTLVNHDVQYDTYCMNVLNLTALNTKAIQELDEKVIKLENKTKKQEEIIKVLASKLGCLDEIEKLLKE